MSDLRALKGQPCPVCSKKTLALTESEIEVPFFGKLFLFSMTCESCKYHKADVEPAEHHDPVKFTLEVSSPEDLKIRVVKSGHGTVKIPHVGNIEGGPEANGYVTNVEGIINRIKNQIEFLRDSEEEADKKKKAKNLLKKLQKVMWGQEKIKLVIEDPTGNSAIISEKAIKSKL